MLTMVTVLILPLCAIVTTQAGECHKMHITVYREILAAIKFGEMARNCLDKYLANLKFSDSHDQIESYDGNHAHHVGVYVFTLVLQSSRCRARLQKMETYEVDSCVHGHHVF